MTIMRLLEELANNAHHHVAIDQLLKDYPLEISQAFQNNDVTQLKNYFNKQSNMMANKSSIVQID